MGRSLISTLCLALSVVSVAGRAHGQSDGYRQTVAEAVAEFSAGNWAEAKTLFRAAHEIEPSARTWRGLGLAAFELRQYVEAVEYLERALTDPRKPLSAKQQAETRDHIVRARRFIARYEVTLEPPDARLFVDGAARSLRDGHLLLPAGRRELEVSAPGHQSVRRRLLVEGGIEGKLVFRLPAASEAGVSPAASGQAASATSASARQPADASGLPTGAIVSGTVGAVLLVASAVTGVLALRSKADLEDACGDPMQPCDVRHQDKADRTESLALASDVLWISGAASLGVGLAFWLLADGEDDNTSVGLAASPRAGALWVERRF